MSELIMPGVAGLREHSLLPRENSQLAKNVPLGDVSTLLRPVMAISSGKIPFVALQNLPFLAQISLSNLELACASVITQLYKRAWPKELCADSTSSIIRSWPTLEIFRY